MPQIRVAQVPGSHPYARHLSGPPGAAFVSIADPVDPDRPPGQWWPPIALDPEWITAHADRFDVMHLHFGFESFSLAHLEACLAALRAAGRAFVFTVHDLQNPQLADQSHHQRQLDLLVPAADGLSTLTAGAAEEIARRWGRQATVIAHPHLLPLDESVSTRETGRLHDDADDTTSRRVRRPAGRPTAVVGMHLGDLRAGVDAIGACDSLLGAVHALRAAGTPVVAEIHLRDSVRDDAVRDEVVRMCAAHDEGVELDIHPRLSDDALEQSLSALDACVLPYGHGTHSGWLELCFDLGVPVLAPTVGHWLDQHDEPGAVFAFEPGATESLTAAIEAALAYRGTVARSSVLADRRARRLLDRGVITRRHADLYAAALESRVPA